MTDPEIHHLHAPLPSMTADEATVDWNTDCLTCASVLGHLYSERVAGGDEMRGWILDRVDHMLRTGGDPLTLQALRRWIVAIR